MQEKRETREEDKPLLLLPPLKLFEVSIIVKFLSTQEKLSLVAPLSKEWHALIHKHYAWTRFPRPAGDWQAIAFLHFLDKFADLGNLEVMALPLKLLTPRRKYLISSARSFSLTDALTPSSLQSVFTGELTPGTLKSLRLHIKEEDYEHLKQPVSLMDSFLLVQEMQFL